MHGCGSLRWSMVHLPEATTLKKAEFTSSSSHQLSRAPQPRVGVHETLPYHVVECWFAWPCSGIMQATTAAVVSWAQWPFDAQETPLLSSPLQFLAFTIFLILLLWHSPSLVGEGVIQMYYVTAEYSIDIYSLNVNHMWASVLTTVYYQKTLRCEDPKLS